MGMIYQEPHIKSKGITNPEAAFQRSRVYELLSHALAEPSEEFIEFIKKGFFLESISPVLKIYSYMVVNHIQEAIEDVKKAGIDEVRLWYEKLANPKVNFFYECKYHQPFSAMEEMADIAGFYRAFNVYAQEDRPDHLSMELEFMRLLTLKEAKALLNNEMENKDICLSTEKKFLTAHLGRWTMSLVCLSEGVKFYSSMIRFLNEWVIAECQYLSVKPESIYYSFTDDNTDEQEIELCKCNVIEEEEKYEGI
jgi:hypothetical protein